MGGGSIPQLQVLYACKACCHSSYSASLLAGLQGQGQTVGMGDTGIDWLHCAFQDSTTFGPGDGPYQTDGLGYQYWVNPAHRKISYYRQIDDNVDGNGHGTHCAGSAVGSLQSPGRAVPSTS